VLSASFIPSVHKIRVILYSLVVILSTAGFNIKKNPTFVHKVILSVLHGFLKTVTTSIYTGLTDWFQTPDGVSFIARYELNHQITAQFYIAFNTGRTSGRMLET
jgi:hypothetical protein